MDTGWWVAEWLHARGPFFVLAWAFWVVFSITLHELGHGFAALKVGDDTPVRLGRMTLNPLVHMGATSLIVFAIVGIAWGMMPVNPHKFRGRHADALVAAAGPAVNVGLWVLCVLATAAAASFVPESFTARENVLDFFWLGAMLNAVLLALNLLPVPPLDGSRILASFSGAYRRVIEGPNASMISLIGILFVFFVAGDFLFGFASEITRDAIGVVQLVFPG